MKKEAMTMQYRQFGRMAEQVSVLGFGAMRMPMAGGEIDEPEAIRMIRRAIDGGVNYVDTAYFYHDGKSEGLVGKALKDGYREKAYVATKSPIVLHKCPEDFDRCLETQLERLDIGAIDFYLMHALDRNGWANVAVPFGLIDKMEKAKADGKIRHIGFSFHDDFDTFRRIIDSYDGWEFCQIQFNYINTDYQAGLQGLEYAASKGLGVIVMEPLLGGKLASPVPGVQRVLSEERGPVEWALDFVWDRPEVSLLLSGMSTMEQVEQNLDYASRAVPGMLTDPQRRMFADAKVAYDTMALVPCTKCAYCMPCPFGVEIPKVFEAYNRSAVVSPEEAAAAYAAVEGKAELCRACGKCARHCPQHIDIPGRMKEVAAKFAAESK